MPRDTCSWLLCLLICDALGLDHLHDPQLVPRPASLTTDGAVVTVTWQSLVRAVQHAMFSHRVGLKWWLRHTDGARHWPAALQEHLIEITDVAYTAAHGPWPSEWISLSSVLADYAVRASSAAVAARAGGRAMTYAEQRLVEEARREATLAIGSDAPTSRCDQVVCVRPCHDTPSDDDLSVRDPELAFVRTAVPDTTVADGCGDDTRATTGSTSPVPCAICIVPLGDEAIYRLTCGHTFHNSCLANLVAHSRDDAYMSELSCPLCRASIHSEDVDAILAAAVPPGVAIDQPEFPPERERGVGDRERPLSAMDEVPVIDCITSPFHHYRGVPSGLTTDWARVVSYVLDMIERATTDRVRERALKFYLCMHDVLLRCPLRGGRRGQVEIASRFQQWRDGYFDELIARWRQDRVTQLERIAVARQRFQRLSADQRKSATVHMALELIEEGELSRAQRLLSSNGLAALTLGVLEQLRSKHPLRAEAMPSEPPPPGRGFHISLDATFRRLRRRAGAGPRGLLNEHLKVLIGTFDDAQAASVMPRYDTFASNLANGAMPALFYLAISATRVVPLRKSAPVEADETPDVRPVRIGECDRRAVEKAVVAVSQPAIVAQLVPQQLAVGVPNGMSILVHGMRALMDQHPDWVLVRIDLENAFNAINR